MSIACRGRFRLMAGAARSTFAAPHSGLDAAHGVAGVPMERMEAQTAMEAATGPQSAADFEPSRPSSAGDAVPVDANATPAPRTMEDVAADLSLDAGAAPWTGAETVEARPLPAAPPPFEQPAAASVSVTMNRATGQPEVRWTACADVAHALGMLACGVDLLKAVLARGTLPAASSAAASPAPMVVPAIPLPDGVPAVHAGNQPAEANGVLPQMPAAAFPLGPLVVPAS